MIKRAAIALLLVAGSAAYADSWMPPSKQAYLSPDVSARLTVIPSDLESSLAYFEDKVAGREPAGAPAGAKGNTATAALERRSASGRWQTAWSKPLVNEVAPVDVVVANGGDGFATLDNWHSVGHGPNAIVIYRGDGTLVRQLSLNEIFPDWFVAALPHSVSSISWRETPRLSQDQRHLIIPVKQPAPFSIDGGPVVDLHIRLSDGTPTNIQSREWRTALHSAANAALTMCAVEREEREQWNAPISAPKTNREEDWHHYLRETQYRTKWSDDPPSAGTTVLRLPSAPDFQASVKWLEEALTETAVIEHDLRAIGSPDIARLTVEIERIGRKIRRGQLTDVDLVIVADADHAGRIRSAIGQSGATLTIIDPARSFPQIKQRIHDEAELIVCKAPKNISSHAGWWLVLPFVALASGILLLRPRSDSGRGSRR